MNKKSWLYRSLAFLMAILLCLTGIPANGMKVYAEEGTSTTYWTDSGNYSTAFSSGTGTETDPFIIKSAADLAQIAKSYNSTGLTSGIYFKVADDVTTIDLSDHEWVPITDFQGNFDGNGVKITGLRIGSATEAHDATSYVGMFGRLSSGAVVKNLTADVEIYTNVNTTTLNAHHMVGGIAGRNVGATVDGCTVTGKIVSQASGSKNLRVGGIAGETQKAAVISNCTNNVVVSANGDAGSTFAGGVAGYLTDNDSNTFIINCSNQGEVTGSGKKGVYTGGIIGATVNTGSDKTDTKMYLLNCYNAGKVTASGDETDSIKTGSIVGQVQSCNLGYLYWEKQTAGYAFGYIVSYGKGTDAKTAGMEADALKAYAGTLNTNIAAIESDATLPSLGLKAWAVGSDGYPIPTYYVAQIDTNNYGSLQGAINAATEGAEITLLDDIVYEGDLAIGEKITLDLNGNTLDMGDNYLYSFGDVVDSSTNKAGRLKIATETVEVVGEGNTESSVKPKGKLAAGNSQMPVYIAEEGYMLASMTAQATQTKAEDLSFFNSISRPSFGAAHVDKLQSGASAAKLQFILRLDWTKDGTSDYQEFYYSDSLVQTVYKQDKAFSVTVNGLTDYASSMKVSEYVISDLGVVLENNSFYMNEPSSE